MSSSGRAGAPSRSQEAFRWLLSGDNDEDERPRRKGDSRPAGDKRKGKGGGRRSGGGDARGTSRTYIPGFKLREEVEAVTAKPPADASGLESLREAFDGMFPPELIADVLASCGGNPTAATDALLALAGSDGSAPQPAAEPHRAEPAAAEQPCATRAAAGVAAEAEAGAGAQRAPAPPCHWDTLPSEVKHLVLEQLSLRNLARAARTCRELAAHVRQQRRSLQVVVVPEGVSLTAVRSLVAAFGGARGVALSRCAPRLRFQHEFDDMLRAVALGEADRSSGVPVSYLSLARCGAATDSVVAAACDTLAHLTRLDLSRCAEVSDAAVHRLAAYTRRPETGDSGSDEEGGAADAAAEAAAAAVDGLHVSGRPSQHAGPAAPAGLESPESAVRRIAAQRHAAMVEGAAAAQRAQHGRPTTLGLRELCLKETGVSGRGVRALLQPGSATSRSLRVLDVSRCAALGADLDLHPRASLEVLRASGCCSLRTVVIQLPPEAPLRALHLDGCRQLLEVTLVAPRLLELNLSHCGQLRSLSLRCRRLRQLRAVNCSSLSLSAGELRCPELEEVNLFGCRQLDADGLEAAAASLAGCRSLDLTGCTALSRLLLPEAAALRAVSVSGCGLLRQVLLSSPHLRQFKAAGCARLMELRLGTASLASLDLENCGNLREVQLSQGGGGPAAGAGPAGEAASTSGSADEEAAAKPRRPALVLKGCTSLPNDAKERIRAAVMGQP